jgi:hypothetical protein
VSGTVDVAAIVKSIQPKGLPAAAGVASSRSITTANLPEGFWLSSTEMSHIRTEAHASTLSADGLLVAVLARVAFLTPRSIRLPAIVGSEASLNFFAAIVSESGGGKSSTMRAARGLIPTPDDDELIDPLQVSSGEGLIEAFFELASDPNDPLGKKLIKTQTKTAALAEIDEGQTLFSQKDRKGSTLMQTLRSGWSGSALGQHNASADRCRSLAADSYRLAVLAGFQLEFAAELIADAEGGTPQRFVFASGTDPNVPAAPLSHPGPLGWSRPADIDNRPPMQVPSSVADEIRRRRVAITQGAVKNDPLNAHADLVRLKVAALIAITEGRDGVAVADWTRAGLLMNVSDANRANAIEYAKRQATTALNRKAAAHSHIAARTEDDSERRSLLSGAACIARRVHKLGSTISRGEATKATNGRHREFATLDAMFDLAEANDWIKRDGDGWRPGASCPA